MNEKRQESTEASDNPFLREVEEIRRAAFARPKGDSPFTDEQIQEWAEGMLKALGGEDKLK